MRVIIGEGSSLPRRFWGVFNAKVHPDSGMVTIGSMTGYMREFFPPISISKKEFDDNVEAGKIIIQLHD